MAAPSPPSTEAPTGSPTQYQPEDMTQSTKAGSAGGGGRASFLVMSAVYVASRYNRVA